MPAKKRQRARKPSAIEPNTTEKPAGDPPKLKGEIEKYPVPLVISGLLLIGWLVYLAIIAIRAHS